MPLARLSEVLCFVLEGMWREGETKEKREAIGAKNEKVQFKLKNKGILEIDGGTIYLDSFKTSLPREKSLAVFAREMGC